MKSMRYIIISVICALVLTSCLKRDNPLDGKNDENEKKGVVLKFDKYSVVSDDNGDKIVNKGEAVYLKIDLRNTGSNHATAVYATFSTTSSYIIDFYPTNSVFYGDISAGNIQSTGYGVSGYAPTYSAYTIHFTVSNTTPAGTKIPITISMVDENNNTWEDSFEVTVEAIKAQIKFDKYTVICDNNGDKIVNKGETVYLKIDLKNTGSSRADDVEATFSTTSSYISGFSPTNSVYYGDISAGSIQGIGNGTSGYAPNYSAYTINFTVSNTTPAGTKIPITISMVDENDNTWEDSFEVTVEATKAQIKFDKYTVICDDNGDKIVNKGETVYLKIDLKNTGSSRADDVEATFSTTSSYISGFSPINSVYYGDISAGNIQGIGNGTSGYAPNYSAYTIKFTVSNTTPTGAQIPITINIVDECDNTWTSDFNVTVQ